MKSLILTIGHNVEGARTWTPGEVRRAFERATNVSGYTAIPCRGMWQGAGEDSTRFEVHGLSDEHAAQVMDTLPDLAEALRQQCIMAEVRECAVIWIEPAAAAEIAATA